VFIAHLKRKSLPVRGCSGARCGFPPGRL